MMVTCPIVKILSLQNDEAFYAISGSKIFKINEKNSQVIICVAHPEEKKWTSVAAMSQNEKLLAVCDNEKNLYLYETSTFNLSSVPMRLAKTATSVKFTDFPVEGTLLLSDKFGDVLRFQIGEEFDRWARESQKNAKSLSIHSKTAAKSQNGGKRTHNEATAATEEETEILPLEDAALDSEAHHCTIIGHISMITDLQVLPIEGSPKAVGTGGLIVTCDRDEKVRLTRADQPERIHSFGLGHREFVGNLATCAKTRCIYSAGGDDFVAEWQVIGDDCEKLNLKSKIKVESEGHGGVQEIKVNCAGNELFVHVGKIGLLYFKAPESENWILKDTFSFEGFQLTAFDFSSNGIISSFWSPECGVKTGLISNFDFSSFDQITVAEGEEIIELLSKSKLRKDVERMDWKQKKHANQKQL